ncbi:neutral alpha-glucosidase AB isoform X1 [Lampetra planeri]
MEVGEATVEEEASQSKTFKTWQDSAFCRRQRALEQGVCPYRVDIGRRILTDKNALFPLLHQGNESELGLEVSSLRDGVVRVRINETRPLRPRYQVPDVLLGEPDTQRWTEESVDEKRVTLGAGEVSVVVTAAPFQAEVRLAGNPFVSLNPQGLLHFEVLQERPERAVGVSGVETPANDDPKATEASSGADVDSDGLWEETFNEVVDIKMNGPSSVGLDFALPDCGHVYGIPERATSFRLKPTTEGSPYRMFNLDTFGYKLHNPQGLYGAVPLLLAHSARRTSAIFWLNSSETWVDVSTTQQQQPPVPSEPSASQSSSARDRVDTGVRWMSESGIIDVFVLPGPTPCDVFRQYAALTEPSGSPPLGVQARRPCHPSSRSATTRAAGPSRRRPTRGRLTAASGGAASRATSCGSTLSTRTASGTSRGMPVASPTPSASRTTSRRKVVTIVDPHIKVDDEYFVYSEGNARGYFIRNPDGSNYEGRCWPGLSSYLDLTNPEVRDWYASKFDYCNYKNSTAALFTWNDMNEPAVFHSIEKTVPRNCLQWGGWEHRDNHNLYGFYQQMASAAGLVRRSGGLERPFVLTRSFFAGSQRYGAVWTGDSLATWDYLRMSTPMLLSLSVCGISLCGADVGGFFEEPQSQAMVLRWFQAGSLQPFFRVHSAKVRREPWLMGASGEKLIRRAVALRYSLLPYWYTQFYRAHRTGQPVMRPLWVEFPSDEETFVLEDQYMIGNALLARPVTEDNVDTVQVYLPGRSEAWYDIHNHKRYPAPGKIAQRVNMSSIPLYQRAGTIIPQKLRLRDSTELMKDDPYTLLVAVDPGGCAEGELFIDDGHSFLYKTQQRFLHRGFSFSDSTLTCRSLDTAGSMESRVQVEKVVVLGVRRPVRVLRSLPGGKKKTLHFGYNASSSVLVVKNVGVPIASDWSISLTLKQGHKSS